MEESNETQSAEELLRKIQKLEVQHAHIKQQIFKLKTSGSHSPCSPLPRAIGGRVIEPMLTDGQYLNILQSMGQAIHVFDHKYRIHFWNRSAEKLYGLTAAEVFGKTPTEILVDPKDAVLADYLLERTVNGESWSGEFPVTTKTGETFVVCCTNTPFRDANGRLIGGICISSDSRPYRMTSVAKILNLTNVHSNDSIKSEASNCEHIGTSHFGVFSTDHFTENKHGLLLSTAEKWMSKMRNVWRWKENKSGENESLVAKLCYFGWQRLHINQDERVPQTDYGYNKIEVSGSLLPVNSTSGSSNFDTSDHVIKVQTNYEILWEDLIIKQQIGQGSCGTVYHGVWYGSDVAIKVFAYQEYTDDVTISFKQEVCLMKRLRHPNVLLFMGAVISPKHLCIVTEFLPRGSLFLTLQRNSTRLDPKRRLHMAIDIARGMNYLHHCNPPIVHRDLKSSNLLVDKNWTVKVGDFGLSRIKYQTYLKTKSGKGTPQWMAPEIFRNEQADEKSDVYSYGVVLWEIVTLKIPWDDLNPMQVVAAVGFMNRRLEIPKDVDPLWASLIQSCWCSEPQSRPSFQEILYKLKDLKKKFAVQSKR